MHQPQPMKVSQGPQNLDGNLLDAGQREVGLVPIVPLVLLELVQVGPQQFAHQDEVLLQNRQLIQFGTDSKMNISLPLGATEEG